MDDYPSKAAADCSKQFGLYSWCVDANGDKIFQSSEQNSSRGFGYRNCTDFVAWRLGLTWSGVYSGSPADGNARAWRQGAIDRKIAHGSKPVVGAVAWWGTSRGGGYGHVAVVTGVNPDGSATIEQYNSGGDGKYSTQANVRAEDYLYFTVSPPAEGTPTSGSTRQGGYETALQANTGSLWTIGNGGGSDRTGARNLGVMTGTSPAVARLAGGGYEVAFQANTGSLWVTGSAGTSDLGLGMMRGTSPAITALAGGGYEVAL
ncbi:CHAP domain-containing protein, partial [uncultured Friedmanniella sp.]|uniref:CHAP domain-containing protein n=1 Tax=uncultured Friedmanniella sp. TaxID=335381 RepID=UPI0035CC9B6C